MQNEIMSLNAEDLEIEVLETRLEMSTLLLPILHPGTDAASIQCHNGFSCHDFS